MWRRQGCPSEHGPVVRIDDVIDIIYHRSPTTMDTECRCIVRTSKVRMVSLFTFSSCSLFKAKVYFTSVYELTIQKSLNICNYVQS
jgi:hypothetical protein